MSNAFSGQAVFGWLVKQVLPKGVKANTQEAWAFLVSVAKACGLSYLPWKVTLNDILCNLSQDDKGAWHDDIIPGLYDAMAKAGLRRIGWVEISGNNPVGEAEIISERTDQLQLAGIILDAEGQYENQAKAVSARTFMRRLHQLHPNLPVALCSYRYPSVHGLFPWHAFLDEMDAARGDTWMPQVYWVDDARTDAGMRQLMKTAEELLALESLPLVPAGPVYGQAINPLRYWLPTPVQMQSFSDQAALLKCPGIIWWAFDTMVAKDAPNPGTPGKYGWWSKIVQLSQCWSSMPVPEPEPEKLSLESLDTRVNLLEQKVFG